MTNSYDILIVGGGLTGASLAYALSNKDLHIGLIDSAAKVPLTTSPQVRVTDIRSLALSPVSRRIFEGLGLWSAIGAQATPIKEIHISDRGRFGFTRINAQKYKVPALGYVVPIDNLNQVIYGALANSKNVDFIVPAKVRALSFTDTDQTANVDIQENDVTKTLNAKLIVAADGGNSTIRQLLNIKTRIWDYQQTAISMNIGLQQAHAAVAYERFTSSGPIAMLPLGDKQYSVVWTLPHDEAKAKLDLADDELLAQIQQQFGYRLGKFTWLGSRQSFPLRLVRAVEQTQSQVALIGNASHTLHPIAGQGFNLCLRDVAVLAQLISDAIAEGKPIADKQLLASFVAQRVSDQRMMIGLTDSLVRLFSNDYQPLSFLRNVGLVGLDVLPVAKHGFTRRAMGFNGVLPNLALGVPL